MPISKIGFIRTDGSTNSPSVTGPYIPLYSVLFWYGKDRSFTNTPSGNLNVDYYRNYYELSSPLAIFYNSDGTLSQLSSNPLISCISNNYNWDTQTGLCVAASTSVPNTAATLFNSFAHGSTTFSRTTIYNTLATTPGELTTPAFTYVDQTGTNNHTHSVISIADSIRNIAYGLPTADGSSYGGIKAITVEPILRDPRLTTTAGEVYNEEKVFYLPKNVIVFGANLPSNNYSRADSTQSSSATGMVLPLIAAATNIGVLPISNTLNFTVTSNTVLNHNHNLFPYTIKNRSKKTGQTGYTLVPAGAHSHQVTYNTSVNLRSKILKAYITNKDVTPLANGLIIGYSIGKNTLYEGKYTNSACLPVNWHFCDGNNGTPDLRGYFIYANFDSSNNCHDTVYNSSNTITINSITVAANGNHSHVGPLTGTTVGSGTPTDIGQHTFDNSLNHTHTISTANSFLYNPTDTSNTLNINAGSSFAYVPPQAQLAFIMYNNLIP